MSREKLHRAIRTNDFTTVKELIESPEGNDLAKAKNYYGMMDRPIRISKPITRTKQFAI